MRSALRHEGAKDRVLNERNPDFLLGVEKGGAKGGGYDSNHSEWTFVQVNRSSGDLGICTEPTPPQIFAHESHARSTLLAVLGEKDASRQWLNIQKCKELRSHDGRVHNGRLDAARQRELVRYVSRHFAKDMMLRPPLFEIQIRTARLRYSLLRVRLKGGKQLFGIRIRQRLQEHCINDAENGRVRANAESKREYGDRGEAGILPQHAEAVAHVLQKSFEDGQAVRFAVGFFELGRASEADASGPAGFF